MASYTLDGIALDDPSGRFWLDNQTGVRVLPARRSANAVLPGRDGALTALTPTFEPGAVLLSIVVRGATYEAFYKNLEFLYGVLAQRGRLLVLAHDIGTETRYLDVQIVSSSEPETLNPRAARVRVIASAPTPFWRNGTTVDSSLPLTASTVTGTLTAHADTTATIPDAQFRIKGAISGATITDPKSGDFITYGAALTATEYVIFDATDWTARKVISNTWNRFSAGSSDVTVNATSSRGSGPMLALNPEFSTGAGRLQLSVVATSPASSPTVEVRAKRSFL